MNTVRWGLLSTANINRRLIPAIRASARGRLVAVASRNQARAETYAAEWEIPQAFGSYEAMLNTDEVDAVYIGLPNHLHAEWSIKAMEAGKHVLCEKPFAPTLAEVDQMIATAAATGRHLAEAFMYRHHPQMKIVGQWVREGRLGDIVQVMARFSFTLDDPQNVRMVPEYGGGSLWDVGVYPVSLAQYIMGGMPLYVAADQWVGSTGVDESFAGQMRYPNGGMALFACSFRTPFHTMAEIIGTEGRLALERPFVDVEEGRLLHYEAGAAEPEEVTVPEEMLYLGEVVDLNAAILDGADPYLTLSETRQHVRTTLALYEAAASKEVVYLVD
ncbi:MAG: Gfo/Idh/MocA family oxidoreductase [Candidatus Promineifilaceae bacterium]|nr:Gfo/Idh/MocA family oxidoreductase [Candidatus Promineifilaceae bacterium]